MSTPARRDASPAALRFAAGYATVTAIAFSTVASAPTPIYRLYQENLGLGPAPITLIFAVYSFTMIATFLTAARLSDYVGRRPMALVALVLNAVALTMFSFADSAASLMIARAVQGVATGIALSTLGAMIADAAPSAAATLNSVTAFIGLTAGAMLSGALVAYAPWPTRLVFAILLVLTCALIGGLVFAPETVVRKPGVWDALRPQLSVPASAVGALARLMPLTLSAWALGSFYLLLMPSLIVAATGVRSPLVGAAVIATLMTTGGGAVLAMRRVEAALAVRISSVLLALGIGFTLAAIYLGSLLGLCLGTIVTGVGIGTSYGAALRSLLPLAALHERAACSPPNSS